MILAMKYRNRVDYADSLGLLLYENFRREVADWGIDRIVPVPLSKAKMRLRGYNQAERIAASLSGALGIGSDPGLLIRVKDTPPLKDAGKAERREVLSNAFAIGKGRAEGKILLVDDIYTTGSTIDAASAVLLASGAKEVFFLTAAID